MSERMDYVMSFMRRGDVVIGTHEDEGRSEALVFSGMTIPCAKDDRQLFIRRCRGDKFPFKYTVSILTKDSTKDAIIESAKNRGLI